MKAAALELGLPVTDAVDDVARASVPTSAWWWPSGGSSSPHVLAALPMVNLHFSLLPRWRGAAPVERAILAGDERTGVCVMDVEEGLDTGGVYALRRGADRRRRRRPTSCAAELVEVGTPPARRHALATGSATPEPQVGEPTYAEKIDPAELEIDWSRPSAEIDRLVRLGGAWTTHDGQAAEGVAALGLRHGGGRRRPGTGDGDARSWSRCSPRARAACRRRDWAQRRPARRPATGFGS